MAVIKCKMCGGDLNLLEGVSTAECEFCGSIQTIPNLDDEKKLIQFGRAERLRKQGEFDKAAGIYESIVADYRQEAEAYWGLVLCKYGIEYVDDPTTGKKIPTCHRSSFDSILDDGDFEQALENADVMARRVYREEAKQIEEIRKSIIAVSANETPYDIFICYKETDENGDRTLDSVLAQDVYEALTGRGYRVFFARISLEDKLGVAYEPYIFAALNSARIMLAFGTDYEYFNAVWVKNEWSRFLKLMEKNKDKYLIPCFKGIDAYDMPREFARLQAQDLGKVGALQDLLRGIEKLLPRQPEIANVVQERVVVGGSGDNKVATFLDRGNMALEDGDWSKADSFFEDVLNIDAKNAQAYLGKTLAQERCRTLDAFIRRRIDRAQAVKQDTLSIPADDAYVEKAVRSHTIPGYVDAGNIRRLYTFDLTYVSGVSNRQQQYASEERYWQTHKLLSKAEKFSAGAVAENLQHGKKALFTALADRVRQAQAAETAAKQDLQDRYLQHLRNADAQAKSVYDVGYARREADYQRLLQIAKTSESIDQLLDAANTLQQLSYRESKVWAEHCHNRASQIQGRIAEEMERKRLQKEKEEKARAAKNRRFAIIVCSATAVLITAILVVTMVIIPTGKYNDAVALLEAGNIEAAMDGLDELGSFKDAQQLYADAFRSVKAEYRRQADEYLAQGDMIHAAIFYQKAGEHALAKNTFDFNSRFAVDEYIIAGIMKDGTIKYQSDYDNDHRKQDALTDLAGAVSLVAHTTEGINGLDAQGKLLVHNINLMNMITIRDSMHIEKYSGIRQVVHGIRNEYYVVMLLNDGRVVCAAEDNQVVFPDIKNWSHIRDIQNHHSYILGIDMDGKVHVAYAVGENGRHGENVATWPAVKTVYVYSRDLLVGLTEENTLVLSSDYAREVPAFLENLKGVVDLRFISDSQIHANENGKAISLVAVLTEDGKVKLYDFDGNPVSYHGIDSWREVVKLQTGLNGKLIGITHDGRVEAYSDGVQAYASWTDIVAVQSFSGYYSFSVGVKADGTMVTTSDGTYAISVKVTGGNGKTNYVDKEQTGGTYCNVSDWDLWD